MNQNPCAPCVAGGPFGMEPGAVSRRDALKSALFAAGASLSAVAADAAPSPPNPALDDRRRSPKRSNAKSKKGTDYSLETFRPLLDGTTSWPAVMDGLDAIGYSGFVTFEYFHPYPHYPEALIYQTSDSLDRMLGRK